MNYKIIKNLLTPREAIYIAAQIKLYHAKQKYFCDDYVVKGNFENYFALITTEALLPFMTTYVKEQFDVKEELYPTYSYTRLYYNGSSMVPHTDRKSCEYSISICVSKDKDNTPFPIYMDGKEIELEVGDAVFYKGCDVKHWREEYKGEEHIQVFLHFSTNKELLYDKRHILGAPSALRYPE